MNQESKLFQEVGVIHPEPDDVVIVKVKDRAHIPDPDNFKRALTKCFPKNRVIVLYDDDSVEIGLYRKVDVP